MTERTFSVADVSERFNVTEHTVLAWIRNGELKAVNVGRSIHAKKPRWRVCSEAIAAFEALRTCAPQHTRTGSRRRGRRDVIEFY